LFSCGRRATDSDQSVNARRDCPAVVVGLRLGRRVKKARREKPQHFPIRGTNSGPIEKAIPVTRLGQSQPIRALFLTKAFPLGGAAAFPEIGRPLASHFQLPCQTEAVADTVRSRLAA
jgi:hypothetical protein